jgi:hypothetical protein
MTSMRITWICEPDESPAFHLAPDEEFVRRLGQHVGVAIQRIDGRLCDHTPADGFILLHSFHPHDALAACPPLERDGIAARVIAMDVSRSRIFSRVLDGLGLVAAIDYPSHIEWARSPTIPAVSGFYGLKAIAAMVGAACDPAAGTSDSYCYLTSRTHEGLPHLLADYLVALSRAG